MSQPPNVALRLACGLLRAPAAVLIAAVLAAPAAAWTPSSQRSIAFDAARLAPPDLYRQLVRNRHAYAQGAVEGFADPTGTALHKYADGRGRLDDAIAIAIDNAVRTIEGHRPFNEIAYRLGLVANVLARASCPLFTADHDPLAGRYQRDYQAYLEEVAPRVRRVFYGFEPDLRGGDVERLVRRAFERSRSWYPLIGREYRRVGVERGRLAFDDRSTAYAVAALAYSHAISDIAEALRYIWLTAGGIDTRPRVPIKGRQMIHLTPASPAR